MKSKIILFFLIITNLTFSQTYVKGTISSSTTWTKANSPYEVTGDITVKEGVVLTIEPGVKVQFRSSTDMHIKGGLYAKGTENEKIKFTATSSYWGGIKFYNTTIDDYSVLEYCEFDYAAENHYSFKYPIELDLRANPTIQNVSFGSGCKRRAIGIVHGNYNVNVRIDNYGIPYWLDDDLHILEGAVLTIMPGTIIKFVTSSDIYVNGGLNAKGTAKNHIIFTSYRDDNNGGDSNGDGLSFPAAGDWGGIKFESTTIDDSSILNYCDFLYGASNHYSEKYPIVLHPYANPTISNTTIQKCKINAIGLINGDFNSNIRIDNTGLPIWPNDDIRIKEGAILTIEPGVLFKMYKSVDFYIKGGIVANGTSTEPIVFTSYKDDKRGGDSNGDGETQPAKEDWGGIKIESTAIDNETSLEYCEFYYGGSGHYAEYYSLQYDLEVKPHLNNLTFSNNRINAVAIIGRTYKSDISIENNFLPLWPTNDITVEKNAILTIKPGVLFKCKEKRDFIIRGGLLSEGTKDAPIIFTSYRDDQRGGDSNGDGSTIPQKGDWGGIIFETTSMQNYTKLDYCELYYNGSGNYASKYAIECKSSSPIIQNVTIDNSKKHGIVILGDNSPDLGGGYNGSIGHNKFLGFTVESQKYAVYNNGSSNIYAKNNYWETDDKEVIKNNIYDYYNNSSKGIVYYEPFSPIGDFDKPSLILHTPEEHEHLLTGQQYEITWSSNLVSNVNLEFSNDGGINWSLIETNIPANDLSYFWTVPNTISSNCKIKINDIDNPEVNDTSGIFEITIFKEGLTGDYYNGTKFNNFVTTRIDDNIDYHTDYDRPEGQNKSNQSIKWHGQIMAPTTGNYNLRVYHDDGVRIWIDNKLVFDYWGPWDKGNHKAQYYFKAGDWIPIKVNYYNGSAGGYLNLYWTPSGGSEEIIPKKNFRALNIKILNPNGGETWDKGSEQKITWDSENINDNIHIQWYKGGTEPQFALENIATAAENNGEYTFTVPNNLIPGDDYYIGISDASTGSVYDFSDAPFTVTEPPTGFAKVSSGVTVTPNPVSTNGKFTATFTLTETNGYPITFSDITCAILDKNGNHLFDMKDTTNITIPANGTFVYTAPVEYYLNNPGTYKAVARGKVENWFDFKNMNDEDNVTDFNVIQQSKYFILYDYENNPIPNKHFKLYKVKRDLTESFIKVVWTDFEGKVVIEPNWFNEGDWVKFEIFVDTTKAVKGKHGAVDDIAFMIKLDNGSFKENGDISYHRFNSKSEQIIVVDHTTILFNLVVSVEWDATQEYLDNLMQGFKYASNLVYDATNGQMYINKIAIFDDKVNWDFCDFRILAQNNLNPHNTIIQFNVKKKAVWHLQDGYVEFPRIEYVNDPNLNVKYSYNYYPYDWTIMDTYGKLSYMPTKSLAHEFLHYSIGILDEYLDEKGKTVLSNFDFGLMDDQYGEEKEDSEISFKKYYDDSLYGDSHKVTYQYKKYKKSCWEYFHWSFDDNYNGIKTPIKMPTNKLIPGPNDTLENPNYDVGELMIKNSPPIENFNGGAFTYKLFATNNYGFPLVSSEVILIKEKSKKQIEQGQTTRFGQIRVLGAEIGDQIKVTSRWGNRYFFAVDNISSSSGNNVKSISNEFNRASDSSVIYLKKMEGDIQFVPKLKYSSEGDLDFILLFNTDRGNNPRLEFLQDGSQKIYTMEKISSKPEYNSRIFMNVLDKSGFMTIFCEDGSMNTFFVNQSYIVYDSSSSLMLSNLSNSDGSCSLILDSLNNDLEKVLFLSSDFIPLGNGLELDAEHTGAMYSICAYPNKPTLEGSNTLNVYYNENELNEQPEIKLKIFQWDETLFEWQLIGGVVDTTRNVVTSSITSLGTFALFTTDKVVSIKSTKNKNLKRFNLSQNYPNPFNPETTIKYSIPQITHPHQKNGRQASRFAPSPLERGLWGVFVTLKVYDVLGKEIATLVNKKQTPGNYTVNFNAANLPSGIYFYRLTAGSFTETKKMILLE